MQAELESLIRTVQRNCHIADARHGADYTLCVYLMKMREYYRWEKGLGYAERLAKDEVGDWLMHREMLWESLSEADLEPLMLNGSRYDPFDCEAVNRTLLPRGLVYSGGYGSGARPHFFLGRLARQERPDGLSVLVTGRELARDLAAPPGMSGGQTVFIRRESLRRMLWEKLENWRWSRADNALGRALGHYDFEGDLEGALDAITDAESDTVLWHEMGECRAGQRLGEGWSEMLMDLRATPAELMARAVRDHLADCLVTLPELIANGRESSIHLFAGNLVGMRKEIFPGLMGAYREWASGADPDALLAISEIGREHWASVATEMLGLYAELGVEATGPIAERVRRSYL
jgi:hypothetical protein